MKKMLSLILALVLVLGLAANVWATEPGIVDEGLVDGVEWRLTEDGNLYLARNLINSVGTAPWEKYKEQITKITLGGAVYATHYFDNMPNLTTVHFEKWPNRIDACFANCPKFTEFTSDGEYRGRTCRDGYAMEGEGILMRAPTGLSGTVYVPDFITNIRSNAFVHCDRIEELVLPEGFDAASERAFPYCTNLKTVVFPTTARSLGSDLFKGSNNLESIYFTGDAIEVALEPSNIMPIFGYVDEHSDPADTRITANVYYPADNETWTEEVREAFGGLVTWIPYNPANPFRDVPLDAFYEESVLWALENNITTGATETTFNPNGKCLRAQVVTFLWRAAGEPKPTSIHNPFEDVKPSDFYYDAVLWAVENGITNGADATHFNPMGVCNRAQVVTFLHRAFHAPAVEGVENPFADVPAGTWYTAPILWSVKHGITNGLSATDFGPNTDCNRAQIVTFLYRAYN